MPSWHRTTARSVFALAFLWASAGTANAAVPRLDFPVIGKVYYQDDFGDPRAGHSHQGNDIMAPRKSPVIAVEQGRVGRPSWSESDCTLILNGASGTEYWYLHLNNDLTMANDNDGGCSNRVSFVRGMPPKGKTMFVRAGQLIGYVGNSGNADATSAHLHFELHPNGGGAVSPYRKLNEARRLLFPVPTYASPFKVTLDGRFRSHEEGRLAIRANRVKVPWIRRTRIPSRGVRLLYGDDVTVRRRTSSGDVRSASLRWARYDERLRAWTGFVAEPRRAQLGIRDVMVAETIELRGS
jgi:hypothetical protein